MRDDEIIKLGEEDSRVFANALINESVPNDALRAAAKDYLETYVNPVSGLKKQPKTTIVRSEATRQ
jgi:hypothetical protein